ncbi:hypothetical protein [Cellulomonas massiliensis]|uniref:hypothetical protein n=1 Tax=Cellulomonas massiliensis TaxID=1465811 RepID=UPI0002EF5058|nr:hypothetical protein [Cellulomonas massiliensis]
MIIDCDTCTVRGAACTDCVVTFLTVPVRPALPDEATARRVELVAVEQRAIDALAASGLVPPLRASPAV